MKCVQEGEGSLGLLFQIYHTANAAASCLYFSGDTYIQIPDGGILLYCIYIIQYGSISLSYFLLQNANNALAILNEHRDERRNGEGIKRYEDAC